MSRTFKQRLQVVIEILRALGFPGHQIEKDIGDLWVLAAGQCLDDQASLGLALGLNPFQEIGEPGLARQHTISCWSALIAASSQRASHSTFFSGSASRESPSSK